MRLAILLTLLLSAGITQAQGPADAVFDRLSKTSLFAFGSVGVAATISQGEQDYDVILSRSSAKNDFERLFAIGTPEAKAYALVGIHVLDPARFEQLSLSLRDSKAEVETASGCIVFKKTMVSILPEIRQGSYAPTKRSSTKPAK